MGNISSHWFDQFPHEHLIFNFGGNWRKPHFGEPLPRSALIPWFSGVNSLLIASFHLGEGLCQIWFQLDLFSSRFRFFPLGSGCSPGKPARPVLQTGKACFFCSSCFLAVSLLSLIFSRSSSHQLTCVISAWALIPLGLLGHRLGSHRRISNWLPFKPPLWSLAQSFIFYSK